MGYSWNQNGGAPFASEHQIVFTNNGTINAAIGLTQGSGYFKGDVGIGTTNPLTPLHLVTSAAGTKNMLRIDGPTAGVQLQSNNSHFDIVSYGGTSIGYDPLFLRTGSKGIWIDTNTGNVNLGAVNPTNLTARLKIDPINGNEGLRIISSNYSPLVIKDSANTIDLFRVDQYGSINSTNQMTFKVANQSAMSIDTDLVVNIANKIKTDIAEVGMITHTETVASKGTYYTWGDNGLEYCGGGGGAFLYNKDRGLSMNIGQYKNDFFGITKAQADVVRWYKERAVSNAPACSGNELSNFTGVKGYYDCNGDLASTAPYVQWRECQAASGSDVEATKIEFSGTPGSGLPGLTKVKDNLVVEQNKWGDGNTTGCVWTTGVGSRKTCPINGQFVAGVDFGSNQVYCCDL